MENRIEAAIDRLKEKLKAVPEAEQKKLQGTLKTEWEDLVEYQKLQSMAFACGKLALEEAQTLYQIYGGESPSSEKWDKLLLAEKIIGTSTAGELLKMRLCDVL